ncbi:glycosyltransferase 87 family protein [Kineococcus radiotolerans]|uniref:Integral membrane protein n=1 Tax=Kineococcus radiotolerans (strain ATCC BAA-149 / DSM 14245 / SRS30216) TaxID=266940 RepID=A6W4J4_KINRD|nr:glycosyltransferase 87 family protein [Kineococcus radiotolerans]ABS01733.1 putative integral membrane protein [Kineococcus radiotolerans SRS30216 = ATCC BAA-149]
MLSEGTPRTGAGLWRAIGVLVLLLAAAPIVHRYLVAYPDDQWQVDLQVYREAGRSLLLGRPVYLFETEVPQLLPFTYPTFSAVLSIPLALLPWGAAGWVWTGVQLGLLYAIVGLAFAPLLARAGRFAGLAHGVVAALCVWISPVGENIRFGQVNAVLVTLCLLDLVKGSDGLRVGRFTLRWPRGALVGVAVAIKLTPGVFLVHFALTRQWRELRNAVLAAAGVTVATFLVAPEGSLEFWTSALLNSDRLGPNAGSSNQSLRGFVLRLYLSDGATTALWGVLALLAAVAGFALARALHRRGSLVGEVAACGMVAVLVSPVSWLHHLLWGVVVLGAVAGDGRVRARAVTAVVGLLLLWVAWPWWGANLLAERGVPTVLARAVQNGDLWWACLSLPAMWLLVGRHTPSQSQVVTNQSRSV